MGTSDANRDNAFRIAFDGQAYGGTYNTSGADYAEYFEWVDENPDKEDRRGYFVSLDGDKIKIAEPRDYVLGVTSGNPVVIGNGGDDWYNKYLHDDFGGFIYEDVPEAIEKIDENGNVVKDANGNPVMVETGQIIKNGRLKLNPDYDPTQEYISRSQRPEWSPVGMLGALAVRDDGTCEANGFAKVTDGGTATKSADGTGYRVIKRVSDKVVRIIFK
jgi:hypothetical protein